jgi:hypothetical protein
MESGKVGIAGDQRKDHDVRVEPRLDSHSKVNLRLAISPTSLQSGIILKVNDYRWKCAQLK